MKVLDEYISPNQIFVFKGRKFHVLSVCNIAVTTKVLSPETPHLVTKIPSGRVMIHISAQEHQSVGPSAFSASVNDSNDDIRVVAGFVEPSIEKYYDILCEGHSVCFSAE